MGRGKSPPYTVTGLVVSYRWSTVCPYPKIVGGSGGGGADHQCSVPWNVPFHASRAWWRQRHSIPPTTSQIHLPVDKPPFFFHLYRIIRAQAEALAAAEQTEADAFHHGKRIEEALNAHTDHQGDQPDSKEKAGGATPSSPYQAFGQLSLLDTLPSFMALSAAQSMLQGQPITDVWMRLAAGYMAHSAVEQHLVYNTPLSVALKEAFAWGFDPETSAADGSDDFKINGMFLDDSDEIDGWAEMKDEHIMAVSSSGPTSKKKV